jgi:cyclopropane fatty-acyl-phospholipid synthase-like methyltransferase
MHSSEKPFSPACERNQQPILEVLKQVIDEQDRRLLEIGSGTGQHAVFMAPHFPQVQWYPTDVQVNLKGINRWLEEARVPNIQKPQRVEIGKDELPKLKFDVIFTANTFHIMHWKEVKSLIKQFGGRLREGARVVIYGPFKYGGNFTTQSNEEFDLSLKAKDPMSGIRSFEDVNNNMIKNGFELVMDVAMPANNQMLVYRRLKFITQK